MKADKYNKLKNEIDNLVEKIKREYNCETGLWAYDRCFDMEGVVKALESFLIGAQCTHEEFSVFINWDFYKIPVVEELERQHEKLKDKLIQEILDLEDTYKWHLTHRATEKELKDKLLNELKLYFSHLLAEIESINNNERSCNE